MPRVFGGGHERGIRAGTEPVPLVSAFGVAAEELPPVEEQNRLYHSLRQRLHEGVERLRGVVWISPKAAVPYIVNIAAPGIKSETMLHFLAQHDVYVSSGSACSKGKAMCSPRWVCRTVWWIPRCASAFRIQTRLKI